MQHNKFEILARAGYGARGVVYLLLGVFSLTSAFWSGSQPDGASGALSGLLDLPFGRILTALVALGLLGYVLWKLAQGLLDADHVGDVSKGLFTRGGQLVSAGANLFLMLTAARLAITGGGATGGGEEAASAWLLRQPFGPFALGLAAVAVIAAGAVQIWYGASGGYRKRLSLPTRYRDWMDQICRFGLMARGLILIIIGGFLSYAAFTLSPEKAAGTTEALDYVHGLPFGPWLYGAVALGLVAFGAYGLIEARYRSIHSPSLSHMAR